MKDPAYNAKIDEINAIGQVLVPLISSGQFALAAQYIEEKSLEGWDLAAVAFAAGCACGTNHDARAMVGFLTTVGQLAAAPAPFDPARN